MTATLQQDILWRSKVLGRKISGRDPHVPWDLLLRRITGPRREPGPSPMELITCDEAAQMAEYRVGEHRYWYPAFTDASKLGVFHAEVFNPEHDHYYECRGSVLKEGDVVLDAGACEGFFIRYALDRGARVLAVEPWTQMVACLERTFAPEIADGRVQIVRSMLGRENGEKLLTIDLDFPFAACDRDLPGVAPDRKSTEMSPVITVDELLKTSPFGPVTFLKMDIEGGEKEALRSAIQLLKEGRPRLSIATYHCADDWSWIMQHVRALAPDYQFWTKGFYYADPGGWRPLMIHGWPSA